MPRKILKRQGSLCDRLNVATARGCTERVVDRPEALEPVNRRVVKSDRAVGNARDKTIQASQALAPVHLIITYPVALASLDAHTYLSDIGQNTCAYSVRIYSHCKNKACTFANYRYILLVGISPSQPSHTRGNALPTSFGLYAMSLTMFKRRVYYEISWKKERKRCS